MDRLFFLLIAAVAEVGDFHLFLVLLAAVAKEVLVLAAVVGEHAKPAPPDRAGLVAMVTSR
jgi:hypothetical protein